MDNFKILVVDDERAYQEVMKMILETEEYKAESVSSGEEALELLKREKFNLVLTDLRMNGMDGIELLEEIKNNYEDIDVMLITGFGTIKNAIEATKKGAAGYFIKGSDPSGLLKEIKKIKNSYGK